MNYLIQLLSLMIVGNCFAGEMIEVDNQPVQVCVRIVKADETSWTLGTLYRGPGSIVGIVKDPQNIIIGNDVFTVMNRCENHRYKEGTYQIEYFQNGHYTTYFDELRINPWLTINVE